MSGAGIDPQFLPLPHGTTVERVMAAQLQVLRMPSSVPPAGLAAPDVDLYADALEVLCATATALLHTPHESDAQVCFATGAVSGALTRVALAAASGLSAASLIRMTTDGMMSGLAAAVMKLEQHQPPGMACRSGCAACCIFSDPITVRTAEISMIDWFLKKNPELRAKVETNVASMTGKPFEPCPLLDRASRTCMVYPVRPIVCRTYVSPDREACDRAELEATTTGKVSITMPSTRGFDVETGSDAMVAEAFGVEIEFHNLRVATAEIFGRAIPANGVGGLLPPDADSRMLAHDAVPDFRDVVKRTSGLDLPRFFRTRLARIGSTPVAPAALVMLHANSPMVADALLGQSTGHPPPPDQPLSRQQRRAAERRKK